MSKGIIRWLATGLAAVPLAATLPGAAARATELAEPTADVGGYAAVGCDGGGPRLGLTRLQDATPLQPANSAKSLAILGGQPSALEQMRLAQQAGVSTASSDAPAQLALSPAAGGMRLDSNPCASAFGLGTGAATQPPPQRRSDDFLASKRLTIGRTAFDGDWRRVSTDRLSTARYRQLIGSLPGDRLSALHSVNAWVNQRIAYTEDRELFSRADFWAGAKRTLKLGRGDCEDIALTKMQLLAAAGVPREDMILTIARDLVRNADHAVLIVRLDGRYYLLDNATDEVLDASESYDYRPVLSFGERQTWLHGY